VSGSSEPLLEEIGGSFLGSSHCSNKANRLLLSKYSASLTRDMGSTDGVAPSSALRGGHGAYSSPALAGRRRHSSSGIVARLDMCVLTLRDWGKSLNKTWETMCVLWVNGVLLCTDVHLDRFEFIISFLALSWRSTTTNHSRFQIQYERHQRYIWEVKLHQSQQRVVFGR
jgi:hypothetical protein